MSVSVPSSSRNSLADSSRGDAPASKEMPSGRSSDKGHVINKSTKRRMSDSDAQPSRKKCHLMETRMDSILKIPVISLRSRIVLKQKPARSSSPYLMEKLENIEHSRIIATRGKKTAITRNKLLAMRRRLWKIVALPKYRKNTNKSKETLHCRWVYANISEEDGRDNHCQHTAAAMPFLEQPGSPVNYLFNVNNIINADGEEGFLTSSEIEQLNLDLGDTILNDSFLNDINGEANESVSSKSQNNIFFDDRK